MSATATTAVATGYQVEFGKNAVIFFLVIMNAFYQHVTGFREWVFLFQRDELIQFNKAVIAQTSIEGIRQEGLCFVAQ
jgi:hypothetical protein